MATKKAAAKAKKAAPASAKKSTAKKPAEPKKAAPTKPTSATNKTNNPRQQNQQPAPTERAKGLVNKVRSTNKTNNPRQQNQQSAPTERAKGLVNKVRSTNKTNNGFTTEMKKRVDEAIRGREVNHITLPINNNFPELRTFEVADKVALLKSHQVLDMDILNAIEAWNKEEDHKIADAEAQLKGEGANEAGKADDQPEATGTTEEGAKADSAATSEN